MASSSHTRCRRGGFTLIEVLCSVVILLLMVTAIGRIYASTIRSYQETMKQAERDATARAVMDYISREISMAMFENPNVNTGALLSMRYQANTRTGNFGVEGADEVWFVSGGNESDQAHPRAAFQVVYFVANYVGLTEYATTNEAYRFGLFRYYQYPGAGNTFNVYYGGTAGLDWSVGATKSRAHGPIIENVRTFEIFAYADPNGTRKRDWNSKDVEPMFCMDIYLETMSEADATRAAQFAATLGQNHAKTVEFVESAVRRHYQRIYFPNKLSYYDGPFL
jgi:prepilin-type N-terminal cleavage/methylation domain-containing protein